MFKSIKITGEGAWHPHWKLTLLEQVESLKCCGNCSYYERDGEHPYVEWQCRHVSWTQEGNPHPDDKCKEWQQHDPA